MDHNEQGAGFAWHCYAELPSISKVAKFAKVAISLSRSRAVCRWMDGCGGCESDVCWPWSLQRCRCCWILIRWGALWSAEYPC